LRTVRAGSVGNAVGAVNGGAGAIGLVEGVIDRVAGSIDDEGEVAGLVELVSGCLRDAAGGPLVHVNAAFRRVSVSVVHMIAPRFGTGRVGGAGALAGVLARGEAEAIFVLHFAIQSTRG
jgi:hypothetical protein